MKSVNFLFSILLMLPRAIHGDHHRLALTDVTVERDDDDFITNEDTVLEVDIDPPIRINIFETSGSLSQNAEDAFITAMNKHATYHMQLYFREKIYLFDKVEFEVLGTETVTKQLEWDRKRRVFEKEEQEVQQFYQNYQLSHQEEDFESEFDHTHSRHLRRRNEGIIDNTLSSVERKTQWDVTGTSFLLGGKVKFGVIPAASSAETNSVLFDTMEKKWWMYEFIKEEENLELNNVQQWLIQASRITEAPTISPTKSPIIDPTEAPIKSPTTSPTMTATKGPTKAPTKGPTTSPVQGPTKNPTKLPTSSPTKYPSQDPTQSPSKLPTSFPTVSYQPTHRFFPSNSPSQSPTQAIPGAGLATSDVTEESSEKNGFVPLIVASSLVSLVVFVGSGMFLKKKKKDRSLAKIDKKCEAVLAHKRLDDDDDEEFNFDDDPFSPVPACPHTIPTREESQSSDSGEYSFSAASGDGHQGEASLSSANTQQNSLSSCQTDKVNNCTDVKKNDSEMDQLDALVKDCSMKTPLRSPLKDTSLIKNSSKPPMAPSSSSEKAFPIQLGESGDVQALNAVGADQVASTSNGSLQEGSPNNISLPIVGAASAAIATGTGVAPKLLQFFVKSENESNNNIKTRSPSTKSSSSPITTVTPEKVSKEEFEKGWDVDLPFAWTPSDPNTESNNKQGRNERDVANENLLSGLNGVDGSFPSFKSDTPSSSRPSQSIGDSTAYQSASEMHPLDWSNKGSEYDGASIEDSTYTGEGETASPKDHSRASWDQVNSNIMRHQSPLDLNHSDFNSGSSANFLTPRSNMNYPNTPKTNETESSRHSSSICDSSPSSKGSSKQLINDLVWLEKKIADVKKRVDKLDGDEGYLSSSPPMTPNSALNRSVGSPISHSIVCRDVVAPPGKLGLVIHSTRDGPSIHTVKTGSVLQGKLYPGDLLVAVDDCDTRTCTAEEVMEMMGQKSNFERKITVIHYDI